MSVAAKFVEPNTSLISEYLSVSIATHGHFPPNSNICPSAKHVSYAATALEKRNARSPLWVRRFSVRLAVP